jgi:hypothetical protein
MSLLGARPAKGHRRETKLMLHTARGPRSPALRSKVVQCLRRFLLLSITILQTSLPVGAEDWLYTMQPGDNLWDISEKYLTSMRYWRLLQTHNNVTEPLRMPPGSTVRIPIDWIKTHTATVEVLSVRGDVQIRRSGGTGTEPAVAGQVLNVGDQIRCADESNATLQFADGTELLLQGGSRLIIDDSTMYTGTRMLDSRLRLPEGRLENKVPAAKGPGSRFEITTPSAVIAVRGTEYRAAMEARDDLVRTEVLAEQVEVAAAGTRGNVPEGFGSVTRTGSPPSPPVELLPAPDLSGLPELLDRLPLTLSFPSSAGAASYRAQIAPTPAFRTLLFDQTSAAPNFTPELDDGEYALRVRAIDGVGLEGLNAEATLRIDARPVPPFTLAPAPKSVVAGERPVFEWSKAGSAATFHLQLATDASFERLILDRSSIADTALMLEEPLAPGNYYWRLASVDAKGEQGPYGDIHSFRRPPPGAVMEEPSVGEDEVVIRWPRGLPGQRYRVQLSSDPAFAQPLVDSQVEIPELAVSRPETGTYYVRASIIDTDGFEGPFGEAHSFEIAGRSYWFLLLLPLLGLL